MIKADSFKGQNIAVFGLGRTGVTAALSLQAGGATVLAWDDNEHGRNAATEQGVTCVDLQDADWSTLDALVLSPGIPHKFPEPHWTAKSATEHNVPIICDIEIFAREIAARAPERRPKIIAITGTNGKSTTTTLIGHIATSCGRDTQVGGNIGRGVLDLDHMHSGMIYVLELSSYQLERTESLKPDVSVFLNLTPDHIDRHGDMAGYRAAKMRIFNNQTEENTAVIGVDNAQGRQICTRKTAEQCCTIVPISGRKALGKGVFAIKGKLHDGLGRKVSSVCNLHEALALDGEHNWQNAAAAYAATVALGLDKSAVAKAILSFPGLEHRMEIIGKVGPVKFVNDSKATNADAAEQALKAYNNIFWIAGGQAKEGGITPLASQFKNVTHAYMIGEAAKEFHKTIRKDTTSKISGDLSMAIMCATKDALASGKPDPVVLLSPACASFDQFTSFEARGDAFRSQVQDIIALYEREVARQNDAKTAGAAA